MTKQSHHRGLCSSVIHLAMCVDDNYCCHLAALLASIKHYNPEQKVCCHILHDGLSDANCQALEAMTNEHFSLLFYAVSSALPDQLSLSERYRERVSCITYFRFLLPQVLDTGITRVIYLDVDMLVAGDLLPLWQMPLQEKALGAVRDGALTAQKRWQTLGYETPQYVNAGMLIFNLPVWRKAGLAEQILATGGTERNWEYNDQDILNVVLHQQMLLVDNRYNTQSYHFQQGIAVSDPHIVHFTGAEKPWHISAQHPYQWLYVGMRNTTVYATETLDLYLDAGDKKLLDKAMAMIKPGQRVIIMGAGQKGRRLYHGLMRYVDGVEVAGFVDKQISGYYQGVAIAKEVGQFEFDKVLIASVAFEQEIAQQLNRCGVTLTAIINFSQESQACAV